MINDNILDKIKALLRMAEHPNSNENEAALALERAQALLLQYNLTRADILAENSQEKSDKIGKVEGYETNGYPWKRSLLNTIAKSTMCYVVIEIHWKKWHIFGTKSNVEATLEMYHWVVSQLEQMSVESFIKYKRNYGREHGRTWMIGFYRGAIQVINGRLSKPMEDFKNGTGHDLIIYNDKAIEEAVHKIWPKIINTGGIKIRSNDGFQAGRLAGSKVTFTPQKRITNNLALGVGR